MLTQFLLLIALLSLPDLLRAIVIVLLVGFGTLLLRPRVLAVYIGIVITIIPCLVGGIFGVHRIQLLATIVALG